MCVTNCDRCAKIPPVTCPNAARVPLTIDAERILANGVERPAGLKTEGSTMSRKDELLKLAELFHSQARRTGTTTVKQTLDRMGQYYRNEAARALDRGAERQRKLRQFKRYPEQAA